MSDQFDPFYTWLGIPPEEQPADHYRLLGVRRFENNPEVIGNALDRQVTHVRSHLGGPRDAAANRVLGLLVEVRDCLLNSDRKGAYDRELRQKDAPTVAKGSSSAVPQRPSAPKKPAPRAAAAPAPAATAAPPVPISDPGLVPVAPYPPDPLYAPPAPKPAYAYGGPQAAGWPARPAGYPASRSLWQQPLVLGAAVLVGMSLMGVLAVVAILVGWQMLPRSNPRPAPNVAGIPPNYQYTPPPRSPYAYTPPPVRRPGVTPTPAGNNPISFESAKPTGQAQPTAKGYALQFNASPAYVEIENTQEIATLDGTSTIELWLRWPAESKNLTVLGNMMASTKMDANRQIPPWTGWALCIDREGGGSQLRHYYTTGLGPSCNGMPVMSVASDQRWHHFAYAVDGFGTELYVDGKKAKVRVAAAVKGNEPVNLFLGPSKFADPNRNQLRGEICAFRASSSKRYTQDFDPPAIFEKDDATIILLDFSREQGATIADLSGQGHDGKITGATWVSMR